MTPDDLARILDDLGARLGPAGEYVFGLAVRQAFIEGVMSLVAVAVLLAVAVFLWRAARNYRAAAWVRWEQLGEFDKRYPSSSGHPNQDLLVAGPTLGAWFVCGAFLIAAVGYASDAASKLFNPEYAAIGDVLSKIVPS